MFHVINLGKFMLSLHLDRSFQKLDFSMGTTNTTDKLQVINRPKGLKGFLMLGAFMMYFTVY